MRQGNMPYIGSYMEICTYILCIWAANSHGSRQGVVCCMSGVVAPAGNMGLIEVKGTVAHEGPVERAIPTAWSKTVLHSPRSGGGGAWAASTDGHITFTCALFHSQHCKMTGQTLTLGKKARQSEGSDGCTYVSEHNCKYQRLGNGKLQGSTLPARRPSD